MTKASHFSEIETTDTRFGGAARAGAAVAVAVGAAGLAFLAGANTNWFRYGLSLEATVLVGTSAVAYGFIVLVPGVWAFRSRRVAPALWALAALVALVPFTIWVGERTLGSPVPLPLAFHDTYRSDFKQIATQKGAVSWAIELQDPFAGSHREYLLLEVNGRRQRLELRLFGDRVGGFGWSGDPEDFVSLRPGRDPAILEGEVTDQSQEPSGRRARRFAVDLSAMRVIGAEGP